MHCILQTALFSSEILKRIIFKNSDSLLEEHTLIAKQHENSAQHQGCVLSGSEFIRIKEEKNSSIASLVSLGHKIKSNHKSTCIGKNNRSHFVVWGQNIPLRGRVETTNFTCKS